MARVHLVTGATGFIGSALVVELLAETSDLVLCLTRPAHDPAQAARRLDQALAFAAKASLRSDAFAANRDRYRVLPGDVLEPACGLDLEEIGPVHEVWHAAASLRFEEGQRDFVLGHNVGGTQRVLDLARQLDVECVNYISTAYVAGNRTGRVPETLVEDESLANNVYEQSKIRAEHAVAESGLCFRVLRPSIVIGYSKTGASRSDTGFYGYVRRLAVLARLARRRGDLSALAGAQVAGDPEASLNLIPVDAVVANLVRIARSSSRDRLFHITNAAPPTVGQAAEVIHRELGLVGPSIVPRPDGCSPYDPLLASQMQFFRSYMQQPKEFDRQATDGALGHQASVWPLEREGLRYYVREYLRGIGVPRRT